MTKHVALALIAGFLTSSCASSNDASALAKHRPAKISAALMQPCDMPQKLQARLTWGELFKRHQIDRAALRRCGQSKSALVRAVKITQNGEMK